MDFLDSSFTENKISKKDYQFAFDNDDIEFIREHQDYNFLEYDIILEYCIIKHLPLIFEYYLNKDIELNKREGVLSKLHIFINLAITHSKSNQHFLLLLVDKYCKPSISLYDINQIFPNYNSIINYTHLNFAIFEKNIKAIIILLEYGSRTDILYPIDNRTPIHLAILLGHQAILKILLEFSNKEIINKFTKKIESPLNLAILENDLPMVKLLIQYGAEVNQKNKNGYTSLDIARNIENEENNKEIIDYLIENKATQTFNYFKL